MPGASASTHGLACKWKKHTSVVATGEAVSPAFPARWFYGFLRALPGVHDVLVTVIGAMQSIVANLTPAKGRQDHTTSPSAQAALVARTHTSTASRLTCRDDRDTPLVARPGWRDKPPI